MKILSPWPWPQGHPRGGDGADIKFRPISTIMPNMNEIHQRVFKIWGLINFNVKTLTLWRKDERTYDRTNECTYVRTNGRTEKRKLYTPTYFVCRGYNKELIFPVFSIKFVKFGFKLEENNEKYIFGFFNFLPFIQDLIKLNWFNLSQMIYFNLQYLLY